MRLPKVTVLRLAVALTIWFSAVNVTVLLDVPVLDWSMALWVVVIYSYLLIPVRWTLILILMLRSVRAKPLKRLPHFRWIQITWVVVVQLALGLMSLAGWNTLWEGSNKRGDRIFGFFLHAAVPPLVIAWILWRAKPARTSEPALVTHM